MNKERVWQEVEALAPAGQRQVADFIAFLRSRPKVARLSKAGKLPPLADEPFIGLWRDREDMKDCVAWVRNVRKREWRS